MNKTNFVFEPGKLSICIDAAFGSSGKGKIGSFITSNANNWHFCCNTFAPQAGHWVKLDNGHNYFYQTFNSCAHDHTRFEKIYIGPGSIIEPAAFFREMEENNIPPNKIGISPIIPILLDKDASYERGEVLFDSSNIIKTSGLMKTGTTAHGVGSCQARKILRRPSTVLARDVKELSQFICDVPDEIIKRLSSGQSGLLEIAQGFALSLNLPEFYPHTTSRSVTVSQGLSDMMLPPRYAGNVIINFRSYPIRINSNKYMDCETGKHLTHSEITEYDKEGKKYTVFEGNSGPWYSDQEELTWDELTKRSGSKEKIMEITSVTKLPRRVATFSRKNMMDAIRYNDTGNKIFLSLNFANYIDQNIFGKNKESEITLNVQTWCDDNINKHIEKYGKRVLLKFIGTGPKESDMILI